MMSQAIEKAEQYHEEAMGLADQADRQKRIGDPEAARELLRQAFEKERNAAIAILEFDGLKLSRSVLLRSAASLALECGQDEEAERLISLALEGDPPRPIRDELRILSNQIEREKPTVDTDTDHERARDLAAVALLHAWRRVKEASNKLGEMEAT